MSLKKRMELINALSNVHRFSQQTLCRPESVLEHTACVSLLSIFIARQIQKYVFDNYVEIIESKKFPENANRSIDFGVLLMKASFHDLEEIETGDIARPVKYHSKALRAEILKMEQESMRKIFSDIEDPWLMSTWETSKSGKEGSIVACADALAIVYKLYDEVVMRGNKSILHLMSSKYFHKINKNFNMVADEFHLPKSAFAEFKADCSEMIKEIGYTQKEEG